MADNSLGTTIIKYEKALSEKPSSLVFAPLSQAYCEMGLYDKAMDVLKKGIRYNPSYVLGYVALAQCYYGQEEYHLAFSTLRPLVAQNRDNIKLQLLFAKIAEKTEDYEESLDTYRYLNFLNPSDEVITERISSLEGKMRQNDIEYSREEIVKFDIDDIYLDEEAEEWEQLSLTSKKPLEDELAPDEQEDWTTLETSNNSEDDTNQVSNKENDSALFTHTLVDLYLKQGHEDKAKEILEKILELKPGDSETLKKLENIRENSEISEENETNEQIESEGHDDLMATFDKIDEEMPKPEIPPSVTVKTDLSNYSETLDPLHDFHNALMAKGRDKSLKRK